MNIKILLEEHILHHDLCPGAATYDEWRMKDSIQATVDGKESIAIPLWILKEAVKKHDVHHVLTGYDTSFKGEAEIAAWELASGGCYTNLLFWVDRMLLFVIGLVAYPKTTARAFRNGLSHRNLFRLSFSDIESRSVEELREFIGL